MTLVDDGLAGGCCLGPHRLANPLFGVQVHLGQDGVSGSLGDAAVILGGGHFFQIRQILRNFLDNEVEHVGTVFLGRISGFLLADGEGNGAPVVNAAHIEVGAEHLHFGNHAMFGFEVLFYVLERVQDVVAGGNAVGPVFPGHFQQAVAEGNVVDVHFVVTSVIPPAAVRVHGNADFVGVLDDEGPQALFRPPVLQGGIGAGRILDKLFFGGEEIILGNLGIDLLVQIGAGAKGHCTQNHIQNLFHTASV